MCVGRGGWGRETWGGEGGLQLGDPGDCVYNMRSLSKLLDKSVARDSETWTESRN